MKLRILRPTYIATIGQVYYDEVHDVPTRDAEFLINIKKAELAAIDEADAVAAAPAEEPLADQPEAEGDEEDAGDEDPSEGAVDS